ncbi:PREDICTED: uncharacterized protein LOC106810580 [Priapulus caudatus]|uniref:Uncharacterized protein LOC106810580 n=1 Tax=Priapulus caudatus TaxID=37621 RepID=A0ABM1EB89_PRICU|nr:PREDICTED: uncharacterized protein LOC106810580 [Priapulus caudatus]
MSSDHSWLTEPYSATCQGNIRGDGGHILRPVDADGVRTTGYFDCLWIVRRLGPAPVNRLYMKVEQFTTRSPGEHEENSLEIREGSHSEAPRLARLRGKPGEVGQLASDGFTSDDALYVRLRAYFSEGDTLVISYAEFSTVRSVNKQFDCGNQRYINATLVCDFFDNCGNYADELPPYCNESRPWITTFSPSESGEKSGVYTFAIGTLIAIALITLLSLLFLTVYHRRRIFSRSSSGGSRAAASVAPQNQNADIATVSGNFDDVGRHDTNLQPPSYDIIMNEYGPPPLYSNVIQEILEERTAAPCHHNTCVDDVASKADSTA